MNFLYVHREAGYGQPPLPNHDGDHPVAASFDAVRFPDD